MGFQVNGVEWINNSGHFTQGLKTAQGTAMTGTGSMTTNSASVGTFGTTRNSVGMVALGVAVGLGYHTNTSTNTFGIPGWTNTNSTGMAPLSNYAGSSIRDLVRQRSYGVYPLHVSDWEVARGYFVETSVSSSGVANFSGSWTTLANYRDSGIYVPSSIYMRVA